jgi:hypothetical protein
MITRIVTGTILALLAVLVVVNGGLVFFFVMLALSLIGLNEYLHLMRRYRPLPLAAFLAVAVMMYMAWFETPLGVLGAIALGVGLVAVSGLLIGAKPGVTIRMGATVLGILYLGLGFTHLLMLRDLGAGRDIVLTVIFGTWAGDTVAYFTGKYFGSTPMVPTLSPRDRHDPAGRLHGSLHRSQRVRLAASRRGYRRRRADRRPLREPPQAGRADQGLGKGPAWARRRAGSFRCPAVDRRGLLLPSHRRPGLLITDAGSWERVPAASGTAKVAAA